MDAKGQQGTTKQHAEHYRRLTTMYAAAPNNAYYEPTLSISDGRAEIRIQVKEEFFHAAQAMHGSVYFKALDDATYFAANSREFEVFMLTARFELDLKRPVTQGQIHAIAEVVSDDGKRVVARGELFDEEGNTVAVGTGYFARSKWSLTSIAPYAEG